MDSPSSKKPRNETWIPFCSETSIYCKSNTSVIFKVGLHLFRNKHKPARTCDAPDFQHLFSIDFLALFWKINHQEIYVLRRFSKLCCVHRKTNLCANYQDWPNFHRMLSCLGNREHVMRLIFRTCFSTQFLALLLWLSFEKSMLWDCTVLPEMFMHWTKSAFAEIATKVAFLEFKLRFFFHWTANLTFTKGSVCFVSAKSLNASALL